MAETKQMGVGNYSSGECRVQAAGKLRDWKGSRSLACVKYAWNHVQVIGENAGFRGPALQGEMKEAWAVRGRQRQCM